MDRREIKVAVYTAQQRDIRVIGIVLTHIKSATYSFSQVQPGAAAIDVVLVDANDPAMLLQLTQAMSTHPNIQVVHLVRELGQAGKRTELASFQLMMQLLPTLEALLLQKLAPMDAVTSGKLKIGGNPMLLQSFFGLMDKFAGNFPVVDAASFTSHPEKQPTLTIMALAYRASDHLAEELRLGNV